MAIFPTGSHTPTGAVQLCPVFQLDRWRTEGHQKLRAHWCHHLSVWHRLRCRHFQTFLSRPVDVDMGPDIVRESVSNQGKREVSKLSKELFLCGDAGDTQKHLYVCLTIWPPHWICQQLYWCIHNILVIPGQFFVLVVQDLALEAIFGGICQVFV